MSTRGLVVLLGVTVLAVLGATFAAVQPTLSDADAVSGEPMFQQLAGKVADVSKVTVQTPQYTTSWELHDGAWVAPEHGSYPSRKATVPDLILGLSRMTKVEAKTTLPDWYQYIRVGDPAATPPTGVAHVTVVSADGKTLADAILGARSSSIAASHTRGGMFVREADAAQSWLVEGTASVPAGLPEWFDTILDVTGSPVTGITILSGDKTQLAFRKSDATNATYELADFDPAAVPADSVANSNTLRNLASAIIGVRADDVRSLDSAPPAANVRTVRFTTTSGLQVDVTVSDETGAVWAAFKASAPEGTEAATQAADINSRTAGWSFLLDASHGARLNQPVAEFVQKPAAPGEGDMTSIPLDQNGTPMFTPQGFNAPGLGVTGDQIIPGF